MKNGTELVCFVLKMCCQGTVLWVIVVFSAAKVKNIYDLPLTIYLFFLPLHKMMKNER